MTVADIAGIVGARVLCEGEPDKRVARAFGSDMMSDVLAYVKDDTLLITGLINSQSIRTACLIDLPCVLYVRGKEPDAADVQMAERMGISVLTCPLSLYEACGRLWAAGLPGVDMRREL